MFRTLRQLARLSHLSSRRYRGSEGSSLLTWKLDQFPLIELDGQLYRRADGQLLIESAGALDGQRHRLADGQFLIDSAGALDGQRHRLADGQFLIESAGALDGQVYRRGDMQALTYDPRGISADAFDFSNLTGSIDGGVFS